MHLSDLTEARRKPVAARTPIDVTALLARLKGLAEKLAGHPFDLSWSFDAGNLLKRQVENALSHHAGVMADEDEPMDPLDERELYIEFLSKVYGQLSIRTFSTVKREVEAAERDYQRRHGEIMADRAGYMHDMQYVESSDWLTAMALQVRCAKTLDGFDMSNLHQVEVAVKALEDFVSNWSEASVIDDQPVLVEGMQHGLMGIVPLLMLVVGKS